MIEKGEINSDAADDPWGTAKYITCQFNRNCFGQFRARYYRVANESETFRFVFNYAGIIFIEFCWMINYDSCRTWNCNNDSKPCSIMNIDFIVLNLNVNQDLLTCGILRLIAVFDWQNILKLKEEEKQTYLGKFYT